MENQELEEYAKARLEQGATSEIIMNELKGAGWSEADLGGLFETPTTVSQQVSDPIPPVMPATAEPSAVREVKTGMNRVPVSAKIGTFKASYMIVKGSWGLLKRDKEMMLFPILSMLASLAVTATVLALIFFTRYHGDVNAFVAPSEGSSNEAGVLWYVYLFGLYIVSYFIVTFFEVGIVAIAHGRINGQDLTFQDGLHTALKLKGKILLWSVLAATVGVLLNMIAERSKLLGRIVVWMLGAMWSILSYFIVPVLLIEDLSIKDSLKKSAQVINTTWGEAVIVNVGVGAVFGVLLLLGFLVLLPLMFVIHGIIVVVASLVIFLCYVLCLSIVSSTLGTIFKVVLYEYTTKKIIPEGFSEELFHLAFKAKETKSV